MAEVISRRSIVFDILFEVEKGNLSAKQAEKQIESLGKTATTTTASVKKMGTAFLGAFAAVEATQALANFTKESVELGLKAEGVRRAFEKLNGTSLDELRKATRGTVDDLTLMQSAVRADKFRIPLNELSKLLKFAQVRARETGQSVEFLTNSIVDGIGRKSPLILDNLGLSAAEISEEFKRTGDFAKAAGTIIDKELTKAGITTGTAADSFDRFNTSITNLKLAFGDILVQAAPVLDVISNFVQRFSDASLGEKALLLTGVGQAFNLIHSSVEKINEEGEKTEKIFSGIPFLRALGPEFQAAVEKIVTTLGGLKAELDSVNKVIEATPAYDENGNKSKELQTLQQRAAELEAQIKKLTGTDAQEPLKETLSSVRSLNPELLQATLEVNALTQALNFLKEQNSFKEVGDEGAASMAKLSGEISNAKGAIQSAKGEAVTFGEVVKDEAESISSSFTTIFGELSSLAAENSRAGVGFAIAQVFASQAQALATAVAEAQKLGFPAGIPAALAAVATITGIFGRIRAITQQAQSQVGQFAEGTEYLDRGRNPRGTDTIPILANEGEAIIPTDKNAKYYGLSAAMINDQVDEWVKKSYSPTLAVQALDHAVTDSRTLDYSERFYKQWLATNEHIGTSRKQVKILSSIDRKLTPKPYLKRYSR